MANLSLMLQKLVTNSKIVADIGMKKETGNINFTHSCISTDVSIVCNPEHRLFIIPCVWFATAHT